MPLKFENTSTGGGGGETLAQTLFLGNTTGTTDIVQNKDSVFRDSNEEGGLNFASTYAGETHTNGANMATVFNTPQFEIRDLAAKALFFIRSLASHLLFVIGDPTLGNGAEFVVDDANNKSYTDNIAHNIKVGINKDMPTVALDVNGTLNVPGNSNFTINGIQVFDDSGELPYSGTIVWDGTAPTTILNQTYRWTRIGKMVSLRINISYNVVGTTNTSVTMTLPSGAPTPQDPSGFSGASNISYMATGSIGTGPGNASGGNTRCFLGPNAVPNGYLLSVISSTTVAAKVVRFSVDYFIA